MQGAVTSFVQNKDNGLFLIDMPTGSGKTHITVEMMASFLNNKIFQNVDKIFYLTPLKKNIEEVYEKLCKKCEELKVFNYTGQILWLKSNVESIQEADFSVLPDELSLKNETKDLKKKIENYKSLVENNQLDIAEDFLSDISVKEAKFRELIKEYIKKEKKKKSSDTSFINKIFPACLIGKKRIILSTIDKFYLGVDPIYEKPFKFVENDIIKNSLVFIDEFDSTKDYLLNQIIENSKNNKLDYFEVFRNISSSLKSPNFSEKLFKSGDSKINVKENFEKLKQVMKIKEEELLLEFSFKLENDNKKNQFFMFDSLENITVSDELNNNIIVKHDEKNRINIIKIKCGKIESDESSFATISQRVSGAFKYFLKYCLLAAENYMNNNKGMEIQDAISTILDPFLIDAKVKEYIVDCVLELKSCNNIKIKKSIFKTDFYQDGFKYYLFKDDQSHDATTKIETLNFNETPESFMLILSKKARVVGLSATATNESVLNNYNIKYIKSQLRNDYYVLSKEEQSKLNNSIQQKLRKKENIKVSIIKVSDADIFDYENFVNEVLFKAENREELKKEISNIQYKSFDYKRFTKVVIAIRDFLISKKPAMLIVTNKNLKDKDSDALYNADTLNKIMELILKDNNLVGDNYMPKIFGLYGKNFKEIKKQYQSCLENKERVILISSYPSAATGQNLQYRMNFDEEEFYGEDNIDDERDIDYIYVEKPTNIIVNVADRHFFDDEIKLIKYLYQVMSLTYSYEIMDDSKGLVQHAFKKYAGINTKPPISLKKLDSVNNAILRNIEQAIGRLCRTKKDMLINISVDEDIAREVNFSKIIATNNIVHRNEFICVAEEITKNYNQKDIPTNKENNRNNFHNRAAANRINKILSDNVREWKKDKIIEWNQLREYVLQYPTVSDIELKNMRFDNFDINFAELYAHSSQYYTNKYIYDSTEKIFSFNNEINSGFKVSSDRALLDACMTIPPLKEYFISKKYAVSFKSNCNILLPEIFQRIYQGAIGEVIIKKILSDYGIYCKEIEDGKVFEKFDFMLAKNNDVYIDAKNWINYDEETNKIIDKINKKLDSISGKKVYIINLFAEELDIKHFSNRIVRISRIIKKIDGYDDKYEIDRKSVKAIIDLMKEDDNASNK